MKEIVLAVFMFLLIASGVIGWGRNLVLLSQTDFKAPYKAEVIRMVGILPPVGAIIGWIDIEDGDVE